MNTKQAIEKVLAGKREPMRVPEIIEAGLPLADSLKGKTPGQTFYSVLYAESKKTDGLVIQVGRGQFKLNPKRKATTATPASASNTSATKKASSAKKASSTRKSSTSKKKASSRKRSASKR